MLINKMILLRFLLILMLFFSTPLIFACQLTTTDDTGQVSTKTIVSPVCFHGFDQAHAAGFKGDDQVIAFIENGCDQNHPQFLPGHVQIIDCSHKSSPIQGENVEDKSSWRYKSGGTDKITTAGDLIHNINRAPNRVHGNHVMGIAIGKTYEYFFEDNGNSCKLRSNKLLSKGGCCPNAQAVNLVYSHLYPNKLWKFSTYDSYGMCVYTLSDIINDLKFSGYIKSDAGVFYDYYDPEYGKELVEDNDWFYEKTIKIQKNILEITNGFSTEEKFHLSTRKLDDSPTLCFQEFFASKAKVLNCSFELNSICDFLNDFKVFDNILNFIGDGLEKEDKILVLCANNQDKNLSTSPQQHYFRCFAQHPKIKERFLIAINISPNEEATVDENYGYVALPTGDNINCVRGKLSNWPGEDLKSLAICALGETISGYNFNSFKECSGTSQAAPVVSSLCALIAQKYPDLTGVEIVKRITERAIPFGNPAYTGCGFLWAPHSLDLKLN